MRDTRVDQRSYQHVYNIFMMRYSSVDEFVVLRASGDQYVVWWDIEVLISMLCFLQVSSSILCERYTSFDQHTYQHLYNILVMRCTRVDKYVVCCVAYTWWSVCCMMRYISIDKYVVFLTSVDTYVVWWDIHVLINLLINTCITYLWWDIHVLMSMLYVVLRANGDRYVVASSMRRYTTYISPHLWWDVQHMYQHLYATTTLTHECILLYSRLLHTRRMPYLLRSFSAKEPYD